MKTDSELKSEFREETGNPLNRVADHLSYSTWLEQRLITQQSSAEPEEVQTVYVECDPEDDKARPLRINNKTIWLKQQTIPKMPSEGEIEAVLYKFRAKCIESDGSTSVGFIPPSRHKDLAKAITKLFER